MHSIVPVRRARNEARHDTGATSHCANRKLHALKANRASSNQAGGARDPILTFRRLSLWGVFPSYISSLLHRVTPLPRGGALRAIVLSGRPTDTGALDSEAPKCRGKREPR